MNLKNQEGVRLADGDGALAGGNVGGGDSQLANGSDGGPDRQDVLLVALAQHSPAHQLIQRPLCHTLLCRREHVPCARHAVR